MSLPLTEKLIIDQAGLLPAFPAVVNDILATLDDDNATLGTLIHYVERDPLITARVLSLATAAANAGHSPRQLRDLHVAVSLIGLSRVREIVLGVSLAEFARDSRMSSYFWEHSVAVGICAQELSRLAHSAPDFGLVAGLLHDIGQLWLARFHPEEFAAVRADVTAGKGDIEDLERQRFGMSHSHVGAVLAIHWRLPASVVAAVRYHHDAGHAAEDKLVAATHVAEVLSNALELTRHESAQVSSLSEAACRLLGINWQEDLGYLFGRIEARTDYACRAFR